VDSTLAQFTWYRFRTTLRSRIGGYAAIVLVVGLIGGLAIGSIAGARRTQSAFPAALAATNAGDLQVQSYTNACVTATGCLYSERFTKTLARLPHVSHVAGVAEMFITPTHRDGRAYLPYALQNNLVATVGGFGGEYVTQDRLIAEKGRLPNQSRTDEFAVTADTARLLGWHVGQVIPMATYTFKQLFATNGLPKRPYLRFKVKLTGIVASVLSVVHDEVDRYPTYAVFTDALTRKLIDGGAAGFPLYDLKLENGTKYVAAVERAIIRLLPRGSTYQFRVTSVDEGAVERATKPESIALGAFGAIAGLSALVIASQATGRAIRRNRRDLEVLRACGAGPSMGAADSLFGTMLAVVLGTLLAAVVGTTITPFAPIAAVRQVDPSPGFDFDWIVIAGGFGVIVAGLAVSAALYTWTSMRRDTTRNVALSPEGSSRLVEAAARVGLPPSAVVGVRFAVARTHGREAVPVGSAFVGAALAVIVLVTTVTFASGLSTLVSHPALYGWNWNYAIVQEGTGNVPGALSSRLLRSDKYVADSAGFGFANFQIDGITVPGMLTTTHASVTPPILSGRNINAVDQIVLGGATLAQLHRRVGETVTVSYGDKNDFPVYVPPTRVRIVGTATFPAIGDPGSLHPSMGAGALISSAIAPPALRSRNQNPDPLQNGKPIVVIRLRKNTPHALALASLQRITAEITRAYQADPRSGGGVFKLESVQQPAEIVNYKTIGSTPAVLAGGLALAAAIALGLTLFASVRRRRRDFALLKSLGFVRRQLAGAVFWQASIAAVVGIAVGIPLGIVFGRTLWDVFARQIYAVPHATVPAVQVVLVAVGTFVLANLVAFLPGRIAAETSIAPALRAE
jgi:hypothetical protein